MLELKLLRKFTKEPYSKYCPVKTLSGNDIHKMYNIYQQYYSNTDFDIFKKDLLEKTGVFIIREPLKDRLVGFSTIMERDFIVDGKVAHGFFSGDTIIEEAYWGSRALQRAMFRYVVKLKIKHATKPIYWILISKGFKTYLLLANNYYTHYPNYQKENQHLEKYVDAYCQQFFGEYYDKASGLLNFGDNYQALKSDVAPITDEMRSKSNKIAYFEELNPTWESGTELPCIGRLDWIDFYHSAQQFIKKATGKQKKSQPVSVPVQDQPVNDESKVA